MSNKYTTKIFNIVVEPTEEFVEYMYNRLENSRVTEEKIAASIINSIDVQSFIQQLLPTVEFSEFIDAVEGFLVADDCVIDRSVDSNRENSLSHYISFHRKSDESENKIKIIFHLRLSDHSFYDYAKEANQARYYNSVVKREVEKSKYIKFKMSKYKSIQVGNKKVKDFSALLESTLIKIDHWIERF